MATLVLVPQAVRAEDADDWAKQADKSLRKAERLMFSGKAIEAVKEADAAEKLIKKIEAADADHSKLKQLQRKLKKLRGDLSRRLPKEPSKAGESSGGGGSGKKSGGDKPARLSRDAQQALRTFKSTQQDIKRAYNWIELSKTRELSKPASEYFADIEKLIEDLKKTLEEAKRFAAEGGVTSHPDIDAAQAYLDAAPGHLKQVRADLQRYHADKAAEAAAAKAAEEKAKADAAPDVKQLQADWKELAIVAKEYQDKFLSQSSFKKRGAKACDEWQDWKKRAAPVCERFVKRYGRNNYEIHKLFEKVQKPEGVEMTAMEAAGVLSDLDTERCEKNFAMWSENWGQEALRLSKSIKLDNKEKLELKYVRAEDAVRYYRLAKRWKPDGGYDAKIAEAEAAAKEALPLWKETLKELKWPGHHKDYKGPGDAEEIAKAALKFLREHPKWSAPEYDDEHTPYAACVEGDGWRVWKRAPLTEAPTQYSIAVQVAFTGKADPELVYVYHMVFYTEEAGGVKPGLPIRYGNSKQYAKFRMLKANVPETK